MLIKKAIGGSLQAWVITGIIQAVFCHVVTKASRPVNNVNK
jgi:hypothetical protein